MSSFEKCIGPILDHEGGYVVDHAGPTNWGITLATLQRAGHDLGDVDLDGDIDADDIRKLSKTDAKRVYKQEWWQKYAYNKITSDAKSCKLLDLSVNMGQRQAGLLAQRACNRYGTNLTVDGIVGPLTRKAINDLDPWKFLKGIREEAEKFYRLILKRNPSEFMKYKNGWLNRAHF